MRTLAKRALRWLITRLQGGIEPDAVTVFSRTIYFVDIPSAGLVAHESVHAFDQREEPVLYYVKYAWYHVTRGYLNNPYENRAREEQARVDAIVSDSDEVTTA